MASVFRWQFLAVPVLAAGCAQAPVDPTPAPASPSSPAPMVSATAADAIARYRKAAESARQAGDLATAATQWQVLVLLAPHDESLKRELAATRATIAKEVREQLQTGNAAMSAGDMERASQAMLRVLALDPGQPDAAKTMREIDRRRFARIQADRVARVAQQEAAASRGGTRMPAGAGETGDGFDVEQAIEMFRAGDASGGLRDLKTYVEANPGNRAVRQRIGMLVADRARELEIQGAREEALNLYEQASALRGDPSGPWVARIPPLRKALAQDYYEKGSRAFRTNLPQAITFLETSLRYDPGNTQAAVKLKEAKAARDKLNTIK